MQSPSPSKLRNFVFGVEDSLVSTVGLLSGIAVSASSGGSVIVTGIVLIFVEAFSMAVGSFLSEYSAEELEAHSEVSYRKSLSDGVVMFISYFVSGFIPLAPYILFSFDRAFWVSIIISLASLAFLGVYSARVARVGVFRSSARMAVVGGFAIVVGVAVGRFATFLL